MGLTYKENVPDTRESPVREMVKELKEFGVEAYGYDPLLSKEEIKEFGVKALDNLDVKIKMDGVIVAVAHDEFKKMKLEDVKKFMNAKPIIVDARGMFDGEAAKEKGFIIGGYKSEYENLNYRKRVCWYGTWKRAYRTLQRSDILRCG
jgi:UDPglucose 6-dehydrogenase/UDP-N-acetyl-D-galactosamine dehydrogenase